MRNPFVPLAGFDKANDGRAAGFVTFLVDGLNGRKMTRRELHVAGV